MASLSISYGNIYPESIVDRRGTIYALAKLDASGEKQLLIQGDTTGFEGLSRDGLLVCELTPGNAALLRSRLPWLAPVPLGRRTSFGFGDRLGLATPGHAASLRTADPFGRIAPIFAQQSVRENTRTGRTPQEVLDDAMWGVFAEGWRAPWGADADHIKEAIDLQPFIDAGYTFYTIDPSEYVDNEAQTDTTNVLRQKAEKLPWDQLSTDYGALAAEYCSQPFQLGDLELDFDEETFLRALVKYGRAVLHTAEIAALLDKAMGGQGYDGQGYDGQGYDGQGYDLEMSVDETDTPTSIYEHYFIAYELQRHGIPVVSLAPRFVGKFQKGVDYMGDMDEFAAELAKHMAILHHFDRYKISIHTGSDKFSIYGIINDQARGYAHVKSAGTSFLEALRVIAYRSPELFRKLLDLAHQNFEKDRKTYFVDCRPEKVSASDELPDEQLPELLEQFDARQLLHVTFGSILDTYGDELRAFLISHEADYRTGLEQHFARHLQPLS